MVSPADRNSAAAVPLQGRGKAVMVCATQEHTGKTSVSMALLAGLVRRCDGPSDALLLRKRSFKCPGTYLVHSHTATEGRTSGEEALL